MPRFHMPNVRFSTALKPVSSPTAVSDLDLLRRARAELERLQKAFDEDRGPESDSLRMEIRLAEQRIADIRARLKDLPDPAWD